MTFGSSYICMPYCECTEIVVPHEMSGRSVGDGIADGPMEPHMQGKMFVFGDSVGRHSAVRGKV